MRKLTRNLAVPALLAMMVACTIEPPLHLAVRPNVDVKIAEVQVDLNIIWEIGTEWEALWYYGWDQTDIDRWGKIEYPEPTSYEVRVSHFGLNKSDVVPTTVDAFTVWGTHVRRYFDAGWYDMLFWSNIDSPDGSQALRIDESDSQDVHATTSRSRVVSGSQQRSRNDIYLNPEIFYSGTLRDLQITTDPEDYDYYDPERNVWVKEAKTTLVPLVYIYLVQVVIYNNNGRVLGLSDNAAVSSLSDGVSLHTGHTHYNDVNVSYEMRLKHDLPAREGRHADILGGKLTTFGLCDMDSWAASRGSRYTGGRADLRNHVALTMMFNNSTDSTYRFEVTDQMQRQAHGGVVTIEIDADTLQLPRSKSDPGAMFDPTITEWTDSVTHSFDL